MNTKNLISEFLKPAEIWDVLGIKSQEDFIEKHLTKGKFHKNVPEKIQNDYNIVERLQFFSYYNYPLIDEAFGKSTRIFEASINLKIEEFGLEKKGFDSLNSKIKRLEKYSSNELHKQWLHFKDLRNTFAHHKTGRLMGITLLNAFKHSVNMINSVFLTKKEVLEKENYLHSLKEKGKHLEKGLYIFDYQSKSFLIWSMIPYTSTVDKSLWVFHPVYGEKLIKEIADFPSPFMLNLKNVELHKNGLSANVIETNESIKVTSTNKSLNLEKYNQHKNQMIEIDLKTKQMYWTVLETELNKAVTKFIYEYNWK